MDVKFESVYRGMVMGTLVYIAMQVTNIRWGV